MHLVSALITADLDTMHRSVGTTRGGVKGERSIAVAELRRYHMGGGWEGGVVGR